MKPRSPRLERYLAMLPSPVARGYAHAYLRWLENGRVGRKPRSERVPAVTARAVRANVLAYITPGPKELALPEPKEGNK